MEHLHLILYTIMMAAAVALTVAAVLDLNEADRIEKEAKDVERD